MSKTKIYTAIIGNYDNLREPINKGNAEWIAILDNPSDTFGWEKRYIGKQSNKAQSARFYKIVYQALEDKADYFVWIDGALIPKVSPNEMIEWLGDYDIAAFKHPSRNCIYKEAERCIVKGKDTKENLQNQIAAYKLENYPNENGLVETGFLIRRNTEKMRKLNWLWWDQIINYSIRDQVSLPYCCWKLGIKINVLVGNLVKHSMFEHRGHNG